MRIRSRYAVLNVKKKCNTADRKTPSLYGVRVIAGSRKV